MRVEVPSELPKLGQRPYVQGGTIFNGILEVCDQALGAGGLLAPIASPGAIARCVLELHADPALRRRMGRSLRQRVRTFYDERDLIQAYRRVYTGCLPPGCAARPAGGTPAEVR